MPGSFDPSNLPIWMPPYEYKRGIVFPLYEKREVYEDMGLMLPRRRYMFFDSYDYQDCWKKIWNLTDYGWRAGLGISVLDLWANKQPTYALAFGRVCGHIGRFGGSGMLAAATTCSVANLRGQKDDEWNLIVGFASVGLIWGYKYHSTAVGACWALSGALVGWIVKRADLLSWQIFFPGYLSHTREESGAMGGQYMSDWRLRKQIVDPGRRPLE